MTMSIALSDCPHCIDEFRFDYNEIATLTYSWRVRVRCLGPCYLSGFRCFTES